MNLGLKSFIVIFVFCIHAGQAQSVYRGVVADSATLEVLSGVHITVKNSKQGVVSSYNGNFEIRATPLDTLLFTSVGYVSMELPLLFEELNLFVRLRENISLMKEITISASRLAQSEIIRSSRAMPKPMPAAGAIFSPFDYFSKWQREKRMLLKLIQENDRTITYLQVVSDQLIREELMEEFNLTETQYYHWLAKFNKQNDVIRYSTNKDEIRAALEHFLKKAVQ
jgi:hypothetical protein